MKILFSIIFFLGLGLLFYSQSIPFYNDPTIKSQLDIGYRVDNLFPQNLSKEIWKKEFYKIKARTETNRKSLTDLGAGLTIASLTILLFLFSNRINKISDLKEIKSIDEYRIILFSNIAWILLIPGTFLYYSYRLGRDDFSYWADSIGIPVFNDIFIGVILFFLLNIFIKYTSINSKFPTKIFSLATNYTKVKIFWECFFGVWLIINLLFLYQYVIDGDHIFIPVNLFFTYILLVLRAGQLNKDNFKNASSQH